MGSHSLLPTEIKDGDDDDDDDYGGEEERRRRVKSQGLSSETMGNVQQKGKPDGLTPFQRRKLKYEFNTFFGT